MSTNNATAQPNNNALMIKQLGNLLTDLQFDFANATPLERARLRPDLEKAQAKYDAYRKGLLDDRIVTTPEDLDEIRQIKKEIDNAASTQALLIGIAKLIAFVTVPGGGV
jgi:hypothetical protein